MFTITEIHMPRSSGVSLIPIAVNKLEKAFEDVIKQALFAFPYRPDYYYYVVTVRDNIENEDFLLIIDPETLPNEGQLFVSVADNIPVVKKFAAAVDNNAQCLGTVAHASKAPSVRIETF